MQKWYEMSKIIIAAGGSGGHIFPASILFLELMERKYKCLLITDQRFYKFPAGRSNLKRSSVICLPVKNSHTKFVFPVIYYTLVILLKFIKSKPSIVIGFGGYSTFPTLAAAVLLRIPFIIHEQNAVFGRVNRIFYRYAKKVITFFDDVKPIVKSDKVLPLGTPVGKNFQYSSVPVSEDFVLLVIGGSQGATIFDILIPNAIALIKPELKGKLKIYQQCSKQNADFIRERYASSGIRAELSQFFENIHELIAISNLVISRAGATSIAEITAIGRAAIYIPYPNSVFNHQEANAENIVSAGGGFMFSQEKSSPSDITKIVQNMITNPQLCAEIGEKSAQLGKHNSEKKIGDIIEEILSKRERRS